MAEVTQILKNISEWFIYYLLALDMAELFAKLSQMPSVRKTRNL